MVARSQALMTASVLAAPPPLPGGLHVFERGWLSSNNILLVDDEQTTLIDSGYCSHSAQTVALVTSVLGSRPLDRLLNTHLHSDHCGGNAALQRHYPELKVAIPPGQASSVRRWDPVALTYAPTGQDCPPFSFSDTLQPGGEIQALGLTWQIHAAPGHDPHSVILFEPREGILISADALWENGFGVVFPELEGVDAFQEVAATLDVIEGLRPRIVIPGHGKVFWFQPEMLERARQRLEAFRANPLRHAQHAVKVLLKFKLLELQALRRADFVQWALRTPYFSSIQKQFFSDRPIQPWIEQLIVELVKSGAAAVEGDHIANA